MLMYRAVGFALRDIYPDILRGAKIFQELQDFSQYDEVKEMPNGEVKVVKNPNYMSQSERVKNTLSDLPPDEEVNYTEVK